MTDFKDQFSKQSDAYKKYRPSYPDALFEYLSTLTEEHELAWDSGTGNGQAAVSLADYYTDVYATDPSEEQIKNATPHPNITYRVERAEDCSLEDASADLVTVAQALHWFDFYAFYAEVKRVLKEGGIFAAWTYGRPSINRNIDGLIRYFHDELLEGYWRYENRLVDLEYVTLPFPFKELSTPQFEIQNELTLEELIGLLHSWSAVQRYMRENGENPVEKVKKAMQETWGDPDKARSAVWKIALRVGRK